jgi:hypothetical protein
MSAIKSNITAFNTYVKSTVASLQARGETADDLLCDLFKGYKATSDTRFVRYINDKEAKPNDGAPISAKQLMK